MEKIAIISDVHGNITALEEVLKDIEKRGIKRIFYLGDMLVKCSAPYECVEKILSKCEVVIKGNCEERVVQFPKIDEHIWNQNKLSEEQKEKIRNLPLSYDFYMSGLKIRLMHSSPNSVHQRSEFFEQDEGFNERMKVMFENTEYLGNIGEKEPDVTIFGHIHKPLLLRLGNKTLINPGAVSNTSDIVNIDGKDYTYGSYLIIEGEYGSREVSSIDYTIVKFVYDHIKEAQNIIETDMPNREMAYEELKSGKYFSRRALEHFFIDNENK